MEAKTTMSSFAQFTSSLRFRLIAIVLLGAVVPLAFTGWWLTRSAVRASETELMGRLERAVDEVHAEMTASWYRRRSELLDLGEAKLIPSSTTEPRRENAFRPWMRIVAVLDTSGAEIFAFEADTRQDIERGPSLTMALQVPIPDPRSGTLLGTVEADMPLSSLLDPSTALSATPGSVLGVFDPGTGVSFLTLPFPTDNLAVDAFSSAGEQWRTRQKKFSDLGLTIVVAAPVSSILAPIRNAAREGLELLLIVTIGILILVSILVRPILGSVKALTTAAEDVARGDLSRVAPASGSDEVARLGRAFNHMTTTLKETLRRLSEREGLAAVGEFAASLSHDVRNALTSIRVDLQLLGERLPEDADLHRIQDRALRRSTRLNDTVTTALDLARSGHIETAELNIGNPLGLAIDTVATAAKDAECDVVLISTDEQDIRINGDAFALARLFSNLILNAIQASSSGSSIEITVCTDKAWVNVDVVDQGTGIPNTIRDDIFQPLVSGRSQGTGMGLTIAERIARSHAGSLEVFQSGPDGTIMRVRLPIA